MVSFINFGCFAKAVDLFASLFKLKKPIFDYMERDYSLFIENLKGRRYDEALQETVLSESFEKTDYPNSIKYALEAMVEIDESYAYKVYQNARKIHDGLRKELAKRGYSLEYRYQGALKTYSNVSLYGDVEIIIIKKKLSSKPYKDIHALGAEMMDILTGFEFKTGDFNFKSIDFSDKTRIRVLASKPTCKVNLLPSTWVDSKQYKTTKNEIHRGVAEFDFLNKRIRKYLPFLNIARINARNQTTVGNFNSLFRLLASLCLDEKEPIKIKEYELAGIVYELPEEQLKIPKNQLLSLIPKLESILTRLSTDPAFYDAIKSPSGKERIFRGKPERRTEVVKLEKAVSALLSQIEKDLHEKGLSIHNNFEYGL